MVFLAMSAYCAVGTCSLLKARRAPSPTPVLPLPAPSDVSSDELRHEKEFLKRNGPMLKLYEAQVGTISKRYLNRSKVLRDIDSSFGRMARYQTLLARYQKDQDPFSFVRDALALPEVRTEITRRMADPEVWRLSLEMIVENLKRPPPPQFYQEARRFLSSDSMVGNYGFVGDNVTKNLPVIVAALPGDLPVNSARKLVLDLDPSGMRTRDANR